MKALIFQNKLSLVCHAYLLTAILSCTTNTEIQPPNINEIAVSSPETISQDEDEISYGSFTEQQLYQTIISELSAQR